MGNISFLSRFHLNSLFYLYSSFIWVSFLLFSYLYFFVLYFIATPFISRSPSIFHCYFYNVSLCIYCIRFIYFFLYFNFFYPPILIQDFLAFSRSANLLLYSIEPQHFPEHFLFRLYLLLLSQSHIHCLFGMIWTMALTGLWTPSHGFRILGEAKFETSHLNKIRLPLCRIYNLTVSRITNGTISFFKFCCY